MLKDRWWPVPGLFAVLGTLVLVALMQGWVRTSPVALPPAAQIGASGRTPLGTTTTEASSPDGNIVTPVLPVVGDSGGSAGALGTVSPTTESGAAASPDVAGAGQPTTGVAPESSGGDGGPTTSLPRTPAPSTTTTARPSTTTTDDARSTERQ